jgi:hypothetical protein
MLDCAMLVPLPNLVLNGRVGNSECFHNHFLPLALKRAALTTAIDTLGGEGLVIYSHVSHGITMSNSSYITIIIYKPSLSPKLHSHSITCIP